MVVEKWNKIMKKYILLNVGDEVRDSDEEYSALDNGVTVAPQRWRPVAVEFIGETVQEIDPPVRREIRVSGAKKD